jgi:purine-binding chemotaxis protein CheW
MKDPPDRMEAAYRARAARLARPPEAARDVEEIPILIFHLGERRYGLELSRLVEVIPHPRCTPVPGGPPQLAGVIQIRGEIRPVWELSRLLNLPDAPAEEPYSVLLLRNGPRHAGLRVNQVREVRLVRPEACAEPDSPHLRWITSDSVAILDPDRLLKEDAQ